MKIVSNNFISICIPSYNRPQELIRLLDSIDIHDNELEIIICEDNSPKQPEINSRINDYQADSNLNIKYYENTENLGYDGNIREISKKATGEYIIYMGDDDQFVPGALSKIIDFLKAHRELGYVLKSHKLILENGEEEIFRYFDGNRFFQPGEETLASLFRKSVFISGFIIKREPLSELMTDKFDGSLLMQLYFLAEIALKHPCAYFDEPLTLQYDEGVPMFGSSPNEAHLYTPGTVTIENSLNFVKSFFKITTYIDDKYDCALTKAIKLDMSKYSYPILAIQRHRGLKQFHAYRQELATEGINCTFYFHLYYWALALLGKGNCDRIIRSLKCIIGKTPKL
jgi:glycosyltransferase involved in cell wall biosynthesis